MLKAAYNYQVSFKDPGAFAHGNKYIVQLLHDSIEDLGGDVSGLARDDAAHFAGNTEPFRHWDGDTPAEVPTACAKCHTSAGYQDYLGADGSAVNVVDAPVPAKDAQRIQCETCHNPAASNRYLRINSREATTNPGTTWTVDSQRQLHRRPPGGGVPGALHRAQWLRGARVHH